MSKRSITLVDDLQSSPFSQGFAIPNNELIDYLQTMPLEINDKISDGLVSLNRITDPKLRVAHCKSAPAALKMIVEYPEKRSFTPREALTCFSSRSAN